MSPVRRTALTSVVAAAALIAIKLVVGIATNSLGFLSEAAHSGTDLAAALLTFFAVGVASRPADATHGFGHGKAEHLSALAECVVLAVVSVVIGVAAVRRLTASDDPHVDATWWAFAVLGVVIAIDLARTMVSLRTSRRFASAALHANALHFAGDLAGSLAVLAGLALTRAGITRADAAAGLFVSLLVLAAAVRMARVNVDVLMDRTPSHAEATARRAIDELGRGIALRRLRMREAGGQHFADVVIALPASAALAEGHAAADLVEAAIERELPGADVVVHVEPGELDDADMRERALAAALTVPEVREIHNVRVFHLDAETHVTLHLKLPAHHDLAAAHRVANEVERAILAACPAVTRVTTHLEPLDAPVRDARDETPDDALAALVEGAVVEVTGRPARAVKLTRTSQGLIGLIDIGVDGSTPLPAAHEVSGALRRVLRERVPDLVDAVIHTEPAEVPPDGAKPRDGADADGQ